MLYIKLVGKQRWPGKGDDNLPVVSILTGFKSSMRSSNSLGFGAEGVKVLKSKLLHKTGKM